jgi:hypothetical protein
MARKTTLTMPALAEAPLDDLLAEVERRCANGVYHFIVTDRATGHFTPKLDIIGDWATAKSQLDVLRAKLEVLAQAECNCGLKQHTERLTRYDGVTGLCKRDTAQVEE